MKTPTILLLLAALAWLGCPSGETSDDDSTALDDDDDAMDPGGQIDGPVAMDFGDVLLGDSEELTIEIRNTGVQPLLVSAVILAGSSEDFSLVFESEVSIVADSSIYLPLDVTFVPTEAAAQESSLILLTSAFNVEPTEPFTVLLTGNGIQDEDGDGFPWGADYHGPDLDCDDLDDGVHPDAEEACDGVDNDCDGGVDNRADGDGDGATLCDEFADCDDEDGEVHPAWVDPAATGGLGTESQPFSSLADALESDHCGVVLMREGLYYEGEAIEISSGPVELISVDGHLAAEVNGGGASTLFRVAGDPVTFVDILFQDGFSPSTAGAVHAAAAVTFERCSFVYNNSDTGAGAILVEEADLVIEECQFLMNMGTNGGAIAAWSPDGALMEQVTVRATDFVGNSAQYGGAMYTTGVNVDLEDTDFILNDASYGSGAILLEANDVRVDGCAFQSNFGPTDIDSAAGGLGVMGVDHLTITACLFDQNASSHAGGLYAGDSNVDVVDTSFKNNFSGGTAGALAADGSFVGVEGCTFTNNVATSAGGAMDLMPVSVVDVLRSSFLANSAETGGAIQVNDADVSLTNVVFNANEGDGAAIHYRGWDLDVDHATVFDNRAPEGSGAIVIDVDPSAMTLTNSILAENEQYALTCTGEGLDWDYNDVYCPNGFMFSAGCVAETAHNILADPLFSHAVVDLDALNDNLNLQLLSPCADSGDPGCTDADGTPCDMGAYGGPNGDW
jgi:hypothetical protein